MKKAKIYKITNLVNGKIYVGQTTQTLNRRMYSHCFCAFKRKKRSKSVLYSAMSKYGQENFKIEEIECNITDMNTLNERETYWIKKLNALVPNGYNLKSHGKGHVVSDEYRKMMSEINKKDGNPFYGKHHSKETIKIIKEKRKLQVCAESTRKKMSYNLPLSKMEWASYNKNICCGWRIKRKLLEKK